jgi:hypothetical protein
MTECVMVFLTLVPLDLLAYQPSPTPSPTPPPRAAGRLAYILGGFMGLGILLLAMTLLKVRPNRRHHRTPD